MPNELASKKGYKFGSVIYIDAGLLPAVTFQMHFCLDLRNKHSVYFPFVFCCYLQIYFHQKLQIVHFFFFFVSPLFLHWWHTYSCSIPVSHFETCERLLQAISSLIITIWCRVISCADLKRKVNWNFISAGKKAAVPNTWSHWRPDFKDDLRI